MQRETEGLYYVAFQDRITKKMIGEGSLENGLYILDMSNKTLFANNLEQNKLWHWRVGHASDKVLNKMMSVTNLNNSNCDICRFSKQKDCLFLYQTAKLLEFLSLYTLIFEDLHL
jgi:GAG-pre-integrase domain